MSANDEVVITIHGVETLGQWQNEVHPLLTGLPGFFHHPYNYSKFAWWQVALPVFKERAIERFVQMYSSLRDQHPGVVPSVIAHSFGTYVISRALREFGIAIDRVVLCGSIVDRRYDWARLIRRGQVRGIRNEIASKDRLVRMFRSPAMRALVPGSGSSGVDGFSWRLPQLEQHQFGFGHSGYFINRDHCRSAWLPYLRRTETFMTLCTRCQHGPDAGATRLRFDTEYRSTIEEVVRRLSYIRNPTDRQIKEYVAIVRENVVREGALGMLPPTQLIEKHASALERVLRRDL